MGKVRKIYALTLRLMNGTVTISHDTTLFTTKELAEKTLKRLKFLNEKVGKVLYSIDEVPLYEDEGDVPVLNDVEFDNADIYDINKHDKQ